MGVIMEATPNSINIDSLRKKFSEIPTVTFVHDLHVWELTAGKMIMTVHLNSDQPNETLRSA